MKERILIVAAHPDDEVFGLGGTIARLAGEGHAIHVLILADGESSRFDSTLPREHDLNRARMSAAETARSILGYQSLEVERFPDNRLDSVDLLEIVKIVEGAFFDFRPSRVFTHHRGDVNIDHQLAHEAVLAACRPQPDNTLKELIFFEVPSSTEWRPPGSSIHFAPNLFIDISDTLQIKLEALQAYQNELRPFPHPRSLEAVEALARWRGASAGLRAAEAFFTGRKIY